MNIYVMVDIEGISGIYTKEQVLPSERRFSEGRKYMTADVNACTRGLKAAGVEKIYVCDCHGGSYSLIWEELSSEVDYYICGDTADKRFWGIEDCDAVVLLGYHAMAGTLGAVLEHTWSSKNIQNVFMGNKRVGEIAFDAAVAAEYGKPVIMVSGDDKACREAREFLPNVVCAEVKKGIDICGAMLLPPETAYELIYQKSMEAVQNMGNCSLFRFEKPYDCRVELTERSVLPNSKNASYVKIIDGRTYSLYADNMEELLFRSMNL